MIETRYDIEYVDPNGKPKSGLGRFLAYLLLLITLLVFLTALVFSNLSNSTSLLITQKIQDLTGTKPNTVTNTFTNNDIANDDQDADEANNKKSVFVKDENEKNRKEIEELLQKNTRQSKISKKQLLENKKLSKDLKHITQQLAEEIKTSDQLVKKVEALNSENTSLTKQLADIRKIRAQKKIIKPIVSKPEISKQEKEPNAVTVERGNKLKEKLVQTKELTKPSKETRNNTTTSEKTTAPTSQMDAIVEAMKAAEK